MHTFTRTEQFILQIGGRGISAALKNHRVTAAWAAQTLAVEAVKQEAFGNQLLSDTARRAVELIKCAAGCTK